MRHLFLIAMVLLPWFTNAQTNYEFWFERGGVRVYSAWTKGFDRHVKLKLENMTSDRQDVRWDRFVWHKNGAEVGYEGGALQTIPANETRSGDFNGLFFYPPKGYEQDSQLTFNFKNFQVIPTDAPKPNQSSPHESNNGSGIQQGNVANNTFQQEENLRKQQQEREAAINAQNAEQERIRNQQAAAASLRQQQMERINEANRKTAESWQNVMNGLGDIADMILQNSFNRSIQQEASRRQARFSQLEREAQNNSGTLEECHHCNADGYTTCNACYGEKQKTCMGCLGKGTKMCMMCAGTGTFIGNTCGSCGGKGSSECTTCKGTGASPCTQCHATGKEFCVYCEGTGHEFKKDYNNLIGSAVTNNVVPNNTVTYNAPAPVPVYRKSQEQIDQENREAQERAARARVQEEERKKQEIIRREEQHKQALKQAIFSMQLLYGLGYDGIPLLANNKINATTKVESSQHPLLQAGLHINILGNKKLSLRLAPYFGYGMNLFDSDISGKHLSYGALGTLQYSKHLRSPFAPFIEGGLMHRNGDWTANIATTSSSLSSQEVAKYSYSALRFGGGFKWGRWTYVRPALFFESLSYFPSGTKPVMVGNIQLNLDDVCTVDFTYSKNYAVAGHIDYASGLTRSNADLFSVRVLFSSTLIK